MPVWCTTKGSEGGVYVLGNNGAAFYRDDTMADWTDVSDGLPAGNRPIKLCLLPRQQDPGSRKQGVWERDLEDTYAPIAQPTVDKLVSACALDTFISKITRSWITVVPPGLEFSPAPEFVNNATARNPKVVFGAEGCMTSPDHFNAWEQTRKQKQEPSAFPEMNVESILLPVWLSP